MCEKYGGVVSTVDDTTDEKDFPIKSPSQTVKAKLPLLWCLWCCRSRGERQGGQGDVVYPIGYSEKPVPDTSIQETDKNLVEKVSTKLSQFCVYSEFLC